MKTTLLLQQHRKCIEILEMIAKVDGYLFTKKRSYEIYLSYPPNVRQWQYVMCDEKYFVTFIARYEAIRNRLIKYYANQFIKLVDPVVDKMLRKTCVELSENFYA